METGECLLVDSGLAAQVAKLPVIDCIEPHSHEVFAEVKYTAEDVYPGLTDLEKFAEVECYGKFEGFVGISPFDSDLAITWIVPSLDGWNDEDDRTVLCILSRRDDGQLKSSVRGLNI